MDVEVEPVKITDFFGKLEDGEQLPLTKKRCTNQIAPTKKRPVGRPRKHFHMDLAVTKLPVEATGSAEQLVEATGCANTETQSGDAKGSSTSSRCGPPATKGITGSI